MTAVCGTALCEVWPAGLYCGPAALVAVTGLDYAGEIRPVINRLKKRRAECKVISMQPSLLEDTLDALGFWAAPVGFRSDDDLARDPTRTPRLAEVAAAPAMVKLPLIIHVEGHYVAAHHGVIVDSACRFGRAAALHPTARYFVYTCWHVQPKGSSR